jgi:hypothetical protein
MIFSFNKLRKITMPYFVFLYKHSRQYKDLPWISKDEKGYTVGEVLSKIIERNPVIAALNLKKKCTFENSDVDISDTLVGNIKPQTTIIFE